MKYIFKRFLAATLILCCMASFLVPAAYGAVAKTVYNFNQYPNYNKLPEDEASGEKNLLAKALTGDLGESKCQVSIPDRFASGDLNWTYETASSGVCGTDTANEHLPNSDVRIVNNWGVRAVITESNWIAYRIKSPGAGEFSVDMSFYQYSGSGMIAMYILPAEGSASLDHDTVLARRGTIQAALDPDNRVGMAALYECTTTGVNTVYMGTCTLEANREYIVVFENYRKAPLAGNSYFGLNSLTFISGASSNQKLEPTDQIRPILVKENVVPAADGGAMGALYEVNGHDYFFLPLEGGKMAIYDLDEWKLVDLVTTGLSYPTSTTVTPDGKVFTGGNGTKMYMFDTKTMTGRLTPDYRTVETLKGEGVTKGIHAGADGKIYAGSLFGGHLLQYDIDDRTYVDLGDLVCGDVQKMVFPNMKDEAVEDNGGVYGCNYLDGMIYALASGDNYSIAVKYDLAQRKVVSAVDVTSQLAGTGNAHGSLLGDRYFVLGSSGPNGFAMIDLDTFTLVSYSQATKSGIISASSKAEDLWGSGMSGHATEVIDGKQYFNSSAGMFSYTLSTGKLARVGGGGYGFRTGAKTYVTLDRNGDGVEEPYLFSYGGNPVNPRLFNFQSFNKISTSGLIQTDYEGAGGSSINIGTSYDNTLYIGAWNNYNCAAFDTETETLSSRYVTGGQTDSQTHYVDAQGKFHLISGNYSACVVYEIDPQNKTGYNGDEDSNIIKPLIANMKKYEQKRIHSVAAGDGYVFAGTIPDSYKYGGGIGVYNSATGTEDFIRFKETSVKGEKVVPNSELWDLSVNGIAYSDGLLYGATTVQGGTGASAKMGLSAKIFVFDYKNMQIEAVLDLRDYIPEYLPSKNGTPLDISYIGGITVDDQGRLWSVVSDVVFCFTYDKTAKTFDVQVIYDRAHTKYTTSSTAPITNRRAVFDPEHNSVFMSLFASGLGTYQIRLADWTAPVGSIQVSAVDQVMDEKPKTLALGANNNLYYVGGASLYMIPVNLTQEDWVNARALDARISALGQISLSSKEEIEAIRKDYDALPLRDKALVQKLYILEEAEAELLELKIAESAARITGAAMEPLMAQIDTYNHLSSRYQSYVKNYETLLDAFDTAAWFAQNEAADRVQEQIFALKLTSRREEEQVVALKAAVDALSDEEKAYINAENLIAAEEKLSQIKNNTTAGMVDAAQGVAEVNGAYFATLEAAFRYQLETGAPAVTLTCNIWEKDLVFPAGAVLDLNGYTLTADSVLTYASNDLTDSSAEKTGLLKIQDADGNMLDENNSQLPLYDKAAGGYRFFEMKIEPVAVTGKENPTYWFRVTAEDFQKIYALEDSGLLVKVKLSWKGGEAEAVADAAFTQKWEDAYNANQDIYLTVSAVNTEGLEDFVLTPCMTANGVTLAGEEM